MKFSTITSVAFLNYVQMVTAATAKYESKLLSGWTFDVDDTLPVITTKDEAVALSETYNNTVALEANGDDIILVCLKTKKQVAKVGGELEAAAGPGIEESLLPENADSLAYAKHEVEYYLENNDWSASVAAPRPRSLAPGVSRPQTPGALNKRQDCPPTYLFIVQSCKLIGGNQCGFCASIFCIN